MLAEPAQTFSRASQDIFSECGLPHVMGPDHAIVSLLRFHPAMELNEAARMLAYRRNKSFGMLLKHHALTSWLYIWCCFAHDRL